MPRMFRRQRRTAAVTTPSSETAEYPPATHRSSLEREEVAMKFMYTVYFVNVKYLLKTGS